jgi:hypothetical protein
MESKITIFSVVDVIEALSGGTLENGNLCMMDNSPLHSSLNQGTPNLCTLCHPGQTIYWHMLALDLQTPVAIRNISFLDSSEFGDKPTDPMEAESDKLHLNVWEGVVPHWMVPGVEYKYRLELQMYEGKNCIMYVDTPSLKCVEPDSSC